MRLVVLASGALDAASVLVDVLFAMVVAFAVLFAFDLGRRWSRSARARKGRQPQQDEPKRDPMPVTSWRPGQEPPTIALPAPPTGGTYGKRRIAQRFPEDPGRLL
jgi:hypothetical protein